jgi:tRNA pseudouridine38-40 synthase
MERSMSTTVRYFFEVAYKGSDFHGWQSQPGQQTVQGEIEKDMAKFLNNFEGITGSGRTDTGVHCRQQFFHANIPDSMPADKLFHKLNRMLPSTIAIRTIRRVRDDAHARFDAISRTYEYHITRSKDPFQAGCSFWYEKPLDINKMNQAANLMLKHENFEAFSRVRTDVNHFLCNITSAAWHDKDEVLIFTITSNRFLRGMVRAIVGTMLEVGQRRRTIEQFEETILSRDRKQAGPAASPEGLYLVNVAYPKEIFLD